ncbi:DUF2314 domain-containing protein [bacterium]|nr:DUF2314 domain-containing protein [bacterium]
MPFALLSLLVMVGTVFLARFLLRAFHGRRLRNQSNLTLILLCARPANLNEAAIRRQLRELFGITFADSRRGAQNYVVSEPPLYAVRHGEYIVLVHDFDKPYFDHVQGAAEKIHSVRLREAVLEHRAWISVNCVYHPRQATQDTIYQHVGRILVGLAPAHALAVFCPDVRLGQVFDAEVAGRLCGDHPLDALSETLNAPVLELAADDVRLREAAAEARRRWPEFVNAFDEGTPDLDFSVKAALREGDKREFVWVSVERIDEDTIEGVLANDPVLLKRLKLDDPVQVRVRDVNDWVIVNEKTRDMRGGFTVKVLMQQHYSG